MWQLRNKRLPCMQGRSCFWWQNTEKNAWLWEV